MLKFAHSLWTLCRHSFWCVVLTRIQYIVNYLHACEVHYYEGQSPTPHPHIPPKLLPCGFTSPGFGGESKFRECTQVCAMHVILSITFIILGRKTLILEPGAHEDKWSPEQHKLKKLCEKAAPQLCCFPHVAHT